MKYIAAAIAGVVVLLGWSSIHFWQYINGIERTISLSAVLTFASALLCVVGHIYSSEVLYRWGMYLVTACSTVLLSVITFQMFFI